MNILHIYGVTKRSVISDITDCYGSMKFLTTIMPLATFVIAYCSVFAGLGFIFNILLNPVIENQVQIEKELKDFQKEVNTKLDDILRKQ